LADALPGNGADDLPSTGGAAAGEREGHLIAASSCRIAAVSYRTARPALRMGIECSFSKSAK
jgi:uroporphyrinogen-III synthase